MAPKRIKHVIEKRNAGVGAHLATAINRQAELDAGFGGVANDPSVRLDGSEETINATPGDSECSRTWKQPGGKGIAIAPQRSLR